MTIYESVVTAINERFRTIEPLIPVILDYEPTALVEYPTMYTLLENAEFPTTAGGVQSRRYRLLHRLCFQWIDNEQAERDLAPYVDAVPESVLTDPSLGGVITSGLAHITRGDGVFVSIGGALYRAIDFHSDILVKGERLLIR